MARIFSVKPSHEIIIDDKFVLMNEENFISFELPGIHWFAHAKKCKDCDAFLKSFGKKTYQWLLEVSKEYFILDLSGIGKVEDYFTNAGRFETSNSFYGTKLRFKRTEVNSALLEAIILIKIQNEEYERCAELSNAIDFLQKL